MMTQGDQASRFLQLTHLVIDGEATAKEKSDFNQQLAESMMCQEEFEQEKSFIHLLRQSVRRTAAPADLVERINQQLDQLTESEAASYTEPMPNY